MIKFSICLEDIPEISKQKSKNGKTYVNLIIAEMRNPDDYGNDHNVFISQTKEERESKQKTVYVGKGKLLK